jgi:nicotinamidase-related amidase
MNTIVNFMEFRERGRNVPTLVLVDMHHELLSDAEAPANTIPTEVIANCRSALRHARACGIPVAFTRQVAPSASMLASPIYPRWIEGFEPKRWDMVFDRQRPSCYASAEFRDMADDIGGNYVVAGQYGELSCLSTAIDALHRDHRPTFLTDALVSRSHEDLSAGAMLRALARILSLYAEVTRTQPWIIATSQRVGVRT